MSSFSDPHSIVQSIGIQPGQVIADFGSGSGQYVMEVATALAATGKVYAVDMQPELATRTAGLARAQGLNNVDVIVGDVEKPHGSALAGNCVDLVIMSNLLFQIEHKKAALDEAKRVVRSGGRVLVIDWQEKFEKQECRELFEASGFAPEREIAVEAGVGSQHYGYLFKKL